MALYFIGGFSMLVWGFFVSTTLLWHGTFTINSLSHIFGKRRYKTTDTSKNNFLLALITLGEGWHNNHHYHQNTANQGWFWWEVDFSYYSLKVLSWLRVVSDLRTAVRLHQVRLQEVHRRSSRRRSTPPRPSGARWRRGSRRPGDKVREALAAAADHLPTAAPTPQPMLKRQ